MGTSTNTCASILARITTLLNALIAQRTKQLCLLSTVAAAISWLTYSLIKHGSIYPEWRSTFGDLCMLAGGAYAVGKFTGAAGNAASTTTKEGSV